MQIPSATATAQLSRTAQSENSASTLVLKKVLDMQADQSAQLTKMMEQSAGMGRSVDTYA